MFLSVALKFTFFNHYNFQPYIFQPCGDAFPLWRTPLNIWITHIIWTWFASYFVCLYFGIPSTGLLEAYLAQVQGCLKFYLPALVHSLYFIPSISFSYLFLAGEATGIYWGCWGTIDLTVTTGTVEEGFMLCWGWFHSMMRFIHAEGSTPALLNLPVID